MFRKKGAFVYKWKLLWLPSAKDNVNIYIYIYRQKNAKRLYKQKACRFSKSKTICIYVFIYKKQDTLPYAVFHEKLGWHFYTKIMTLYVTWRFYIYKARHFAKSKTICVTLLNIKRRTLYFKQFFVEFLKLA